MVVVYVCVEHSLFAYSKKTLLGLTAELESALRALLSVILLLMLFFIFSQSARIFFFGTSCSVSCLCLFLTAFDIALL